MPLDWKLNVTKNLGCTCFLLTVSLGSEIIHNDIEAILVIFEECFFPNPRLVSIFSIQCIYLLGIFVYKQIFLSLSSFQLLFSVLNCLVSVFLYIVLHLT